MKNFDTLNMVLNLFYAGEVYELDQTGIKIKNLNKSNILGYDLLDLRIYVTVKTTASSKIGLQGIVYQSKDRRYICHYHQNQTGHCLTCNSGPIM
jgi:hypothetical protein